MKVPHAEIDRIYNIKYYDRDVRFGEKARVITTGEGPPPTEFFALAPSKLPPANDLVAVRALAQQYNLPGGVVLSHILDTNSAMPQGVEPSFNHGRKYNNMMDP
mmetsp:Transcript_9597/g.13039  ORF Transcript_9597/g.13039 Transcript_9597/m.13039 type:complete len:104 (+) Transcript_9597:234-545(+)